MSTINTAGADADRLPPNLHPSPNRQTRTLPTGIDSEDRSASAADDVMISSIAKSASKTAAPDTAADLGDNRAINDQLGSPVTAALLASMRRDLIASAGKAIGITSPSDANRALELLGGKTLAD